MLLTLGDIITAVGDRPVTSKVIRSIYGASGLDMIRRSYFPRWRGQPNRAEGPKAYWRVVVQDDFEARLVKAVAPKDLDVEVNIVHKDAGLGA